MATRSPSHPRLKKVRLYFPNGWRRHIGDLASSRDKRFNWFLCSQRYKDPSSGMYIAEISGGIRFYDEESGETLISPKDPTRLLIIEDGLENDARKVMGILRKYSYQGTARLQECDLKVPDQSPVCREAIFEILDGVLRSSNTSETCYIIDYAKKNNKCLQSEISGFPTAQEIDDALKSYGVGNVSKVLYQDIMNLYR